MGKLNNTSPSPAVKVAAGILAGGVMFVVACCGCGGCLLMPGLMKPNQPAPAPQPVVAEKKVTPPPTPERKPVPVARQERPAPSVPDPREPTREERRAKARADADATNKANKEAYDAEVFRLETEHRAKVTTYSAAMKSYRKAKDEYDDAKAEHDAAKALRSARTKPGASKFVLEIARTQYQTIISKYPDTKAAADAKALLAGKTVTPREVPPVPDRPVQPIEPKLALPAPPAQVEPVRLPEDIAEERERAEAARRAEEEYEVDGLVLLKKSVKATTRQFTGEITGLVVNRRGKTVRYAQITFKLYDENGALVDEVLTNVTNLGDGETWRFKAVTLRTGWRTYRIHELVGR